MARPHITIRIGEKFSRWTVISERVPGVRHPSVECRCGCGEIRTVRIDRLYIGNSRSCGCLREEERMKHGHSSRKAGGETPEYIIWKAMWQRTTNPKNKKYSDYGGRGIIVCESWRDFSRFIADMGPRPSKGHTIERDRNGDGYGPDNCRWATRLEQAKNKRNNRLITANGKTMHLEEWARELGTRHGTINSRISRGWSEERAVTTPVRK